MGNREDGTCCRGDERVDQSINQPNNQSTTEVWKRGRGRRAGIVASDCLCRGPLLPQNDRCLGSHHPRWERGEGPGGALTCHRAPQWSQRGGGRRPGPQCEPKPRPLGGPRWVFRIKPPSRLQQTFRIAPTDIITVSGITDLLLYRCMIVTSPFCLSGLTGQGRKGFFYRQDSNGLNGLNSLEKLMANGIRGKGMPPLLPPPPSLPPRLLHRSKKGSPPPAATSATRSSGRAPPRHPRRRTTHPTRRLH